MLKVIIIQPPNEYEHMWTAGELEMSQGWEVRWGKYVLRISEGYL